ncbi:TerC family protein [Brucella gallinifaecis]|uniref:TerC family protein n=1 Tax=Brucella gallinifaecis TaxID=215590 RepID=A0A502BIZ1_9HYPH|nr:TerC family protein [Brucella gallinifaecis]TPF74155.1 TerC family protein [Brucella gallinifaecis]
MEIFTTVFMGTPVWMWLVFIGIVLTLLVLDLGVFNKEDHEIGIAESLKMSAFYIMLGLAFSGFVWWQLSSEAMAQYLTAFVVEKTLALDNIFVIALIFSFFAIPRKYQHRVLFWGILGVIVLRGIMIGLGATIVANYHWVLYLFAIFLIVTGIKMLFSGDEEEPDLSGNPFLRFARKYMRVTDELHGNSFFVRIKDGKTGKMVRFATPLFLALVMIEFADLIFAVDSVPAVFTITTDPFIVYTSNIFAILGLRALFFALSAVLHRFAYLKYALSILLIFIGSKMFIADLMDWEKFPPVWSLAITFAILGAGIVFSLLKTKNDAKIISKLHL